MSNQVQSLRGVGSKRGFSYYAFGLYQVTTARDGHKYWRLVASGPWVRSDVNARTAFEGVPIVDGIRHGKRVAESFAAA